MDAAVWGFIGVIIGGVITGSITVVAEILRIRGEASLDGAKRKDDRQLGRDNFQREQLLALQDAVNDLTAASVAGYDHYQTAFRATGKWGAVLLPEALNRAEGVAVLQVATLRSRLADKTVRDLAAALIVAARTVTSSIDEPTAAAAYPELNELAHDLLERTGELILLTFVDEET